MNQWNDHHQVITNKKTRNNVVKIIEEYKLTCGKAIDIGCGAGNDTIYLIENNWNVIAIDGTDVEKMIRNNLKEDKQKNLTFQLQKFENLKLTKCDLIVANYSLPYCNPTYFYTMWEEITNNIALNGFFIGNFFGHNFQWKTEEDKKTELDKDELIELFKDFDILEFKEIEEDKPTALGKMKHWHIFEVVAKKR